MTLITIKLTAREIELLTSLASDQLFRREFIDPKMPGFKSDPAEIGMGKALIARLRSMADPQSAAKARPAKAAAANAAG